MAKQVVDPAILHDVAGLHPLPWSVELGGIINADGTASFATMRDAKGEAIYTGQGTEQRVKLQKVMVAAINEWGKTEGLVRP
jgi:hypothetical protein